MRTTSRAGLGLASLLLLAACSGSSDGTTDDGAAETDTTTETTASEAPANPDGTFVLLRWQTGSDNPPAGVSTDGLATSRLWTLTPECAGDEPCDLALSPGGDGGSFDHPEFPPPDSPFPGSTFVYEADEEVWISEEEFGPSGNCRDDSGTPVDGDFTTMDLVDRFELAWDDAGTRLVGTKTETLTLNDAGRADPQCSTDSDEVITFDVVLVPQADFEAEVEESIDLADEYFQSQEVYASEGHPEGVNGVFDWRVNGDLTDGSGSCGPDDCVATVSVPTGGTTGPQDLFFGYADGRLAATGDAVVSCSPDESAGDPEAEVLTDEGYTRTVLWETVTPVTVDEDGNQVLVARGTETLEPVAAAATEFPDDCATTLILEAYFYLVPSALVP